MMEINQILEISQMMEANQMMEMNPNLEVNRLTQEIEIKEIDQLNLMIFFPLMIVE